jgi:predicted O-methyltransferase YrrM
LQIDALRKRTGAKQFMEAGTYLGLTAERCGRVFERVYTIELDHELVRKASVFGCESTPISS